MAARFSLFLTREPTVLATPKEGLAWADGPQWMPPDTLILSDAHSDALWTYERSRNLFARRAVSAGGCPAPTADARAAAAGEASSTPVHPGAAILAGDLNGLSRREASLRTGHVYCPAGQL